MGVVEDFLAFYNARDWDRLATVFSGDDFVRVGPFVDVIRGSDNYVAFLKGIVPTLGDTYSLHTERVVYVPDEGEAYAQLIEHYEHDGQMRDTPEIIVFGINEANRICRMRLYVQRPGEQPPVGGEDAMGEQ